MEALDLLNSKKYDCAINSRKAFIYEGNGRKFVLGKNRCEVFDWGNERVNLLKESFYEAFDSGDYETVKIKLDEIIYIAERGSHGDYSNDEKRCGFTKEDFISINAEYIKYINILGELNLVGEY